MSELRLETRAADRLGLKGPAAAAWLSGQGIAVPAAPNTWSAAAHPADDGLLVARLGAVEFFIEDGIDGTALRGVEIDPQAHPSGVYPVLRQDAAFLLSGDGAEDVLAQVCNVDFRGLALDENPVIMTSMIGVSVLIVPQARVAGRRYRIWCDPTFGDYLGESLRTVVSECSGKYTGE